MKERPGDTGKEQGKKDWENFSTPSGKKTRRIENEERA